MALPILQGTYPSGDLYANALASAYLQDWRILDPDLSQQREPEIWEKIQRDGKISQAIHQRCSGVAGADWSVQPASDDQVDKQLAEIVREALGEIVHFREARKKLAHAIFRGRAYGYIEGKRRRIILGDYGAREWFVPTRIRDIDKRRFQIVSDSDQDDEGNRQIKMTKQMWSVAQMKWINVRPDDMKAIIEVIWGEEESNFHYYGKPLLESLYFLYYCKAHALELGMTAMEKFAGSTITVAMDPENHPSGAGTDNESVRDAYIDELKKQRSEHIFVHPKGDEISILAGQGEGNQVITGFIDYLDNAILSTALGATLPFGGQSEIGSFARSETERDVSESFLQFDRSLLDQHLTTTLIGLFVDLNWSTLVELGLQDARLPKFVTTQQPREDPNAAIGVINSCLQAGIPLLKEEVYRKLGYQMPTGDNEEELFEGQDQGGMMGGGGFPFAEDSDIKFRSESSEKFQ